MSGRALRRGGGCAIACVAFGCAAPPPPATPVPPAPIDLAPRCLELPALPPLAAPRAAAAGGAGALAAWSTAYGEPGFSVSTPAAPLESIARGFGPTDPRDAFALDLAGALLAAGETNAAPADFRARVRALGGDARVHAEDGWLWLELRYVPAKRDAALALLGEWVEAVPADPDVFAATRRSVALARLAAAASATETAVRAFERLYEPPEGAAARGDVPDARDDWDPATLDAFLHGVLRPESSVLLRSTAGTPGSDRALRETPAATAAPRTAQPPSGRPALAPEPGALYVVDRPGSPQVEILVGFPTVGPTDPDAPALEMLASLLGGDVGGRLFRDLRERQGLAYIIDAVQEPEGRFVVTTRARPDRVPALLVGIEAHLRALADEPLEDCEVDALAVRMAGEEALLADDPTALLARLRAEIAREGRPRSSAERTERRLRVGKESLESVARRRLAGAPIVVLVGEEAALRRNLSAALPDRPIRVFDADLDRAR